MNNKSLYWYGVGAKVKSSFGKFFTIIGAIMFLAGFGDAGFFVFGGLVLALGIFLWATGSSDRFDYKRQSGHIIHRGDN